jgi:hypothetical protein
MLPLSFFIFLSPLCYRFCLSKLVIQVTQPVGYVGTLPAIRINESTAEWTARDCYVSLLAASPPFSSIKLLRNCPIFLNNVSNTKFTNIYNNIIL